jgi:endonuclease YncB( thermonuclease family)
VVLARHQSRLAAAVAGGVRRLALILALPVLIGAGPIRVLDGDTLELAGERIRLWGIDAVEGDQICQRNGRPWRSGDDATAALEALVDGHKLSCEARDVDGYGRTVATCAVGGQDLGAEMVRQGWALDYEWYSGSAYASEQLEAERAQQGLWAGHSCREWRRRME